MDIIGYYWILLDSVGNKLRENFYYKEEISFLKILKIKIVINFLYVKYYIVVKEDWGCFLWVDREILLIGKV